MQERKLFKSNARLVFEQDHARPYSTLKCYAFKEKNFPAFTPTIGCRVALKGAVGSSMVL